MSRRRNAGRPRGWPDNLATQKCPTSIPRAQPNPAPDAALQVDWALYRAACELLDQGEVGAAARHYQDIVARNKWLTPSPERQGLVGSCVYCMALVAHSMQGTDYERSVTNMVILLEDLLRRKPHAAAVHFLLGYAYRLKGQTPQARHFLEEALSLGMVAAEGHLGSCYRELGEPAAALECFTRAAATAPPPGADFVELEACQSRVHALMLLGRFREGWLEHERLTRLLPWRRKYGRIPEGSRAWDGQAIAGRLAVWGGEAARHGGGFGDDFMMLRWLPLARERVGALTVVAGPGTANLIRGQFAGVDVCADAADLEECECWSELSSLPHLCQAGTPEEVQQPPYLRAPAPFRPLPGTFKVGLAWATRDPLRATSLANWASVLSCEGVTFYSFQVGGDRAGVAQLGVILHDLAPEFTDWTATAGALTEMDLVIAIDCGVANLAGALGLPLWVCLRAGADWRWGLEPADRSPWYPTARLFRQPKLGDWENVFAEVARVLEGF